MPAIERLKKGKLMKKINICVVGVGSFAGAFVRCYLLHPLVGEVHVCARNERKLNQRADALGVDLDKRHTSYEEVLADDRIDAVHIAGLWDWRSGGKAIRQAGRNAGHFR